MLKQFISSVIALSVTAVPYAQASTKAELLMESAKRKMEAVGEINTPRLNSRADQLKRECLSQYNDAKVAQLCNLQFRYGHNQLFKAFIEPSNFEASRQTMLDYIDSTNKTPCSASAEFLISKNVIPSNVTDISSICAKSNNALVDAFILQLQDHERAVMELRLEAASYSVSKEQVLGLVGIGAFLLHGAFDRPNAAGDTAEQQRIRDAQRRLGLDP